MRWAGFVSMGHIFTCTLFSFFYLPSSVCHCFKVYFKQDITLYEIISKQVLLQYFCVWHLDTLVVIRYSCDKWRLTYSNSKFYPVIGQYHSSVEKFLFISSSTLCYDLLSKLILPMSLMFGVCLFVVTLRASEAGKQSIVLVLSVCVSAGIDQKLTLTAVCDMVTLAVITFRWHLTSTFDFW